MPRPDFRKLKRNLTMTARGGLSSRLLKIANRNTFSASDALVILGAPRSGSTWLAEIISSLEGHAQIFEPMNFRHVKEAARIGITHNMYKHPEESWPDGVDFFEKALSGKILNSWTASQLPLKDAIFAKQLVVKFVRANMLLPWMLNHLNMRAPAVVIRHPCSIIASQQALTWPSTPSRKLLSTPYLDQHPEIRSACSKFDSKTERAAITWCLRYHPILNFPERNKFILLCYENLVANGKEELQRLFNYWNLSLDSKVLARMSTPSNTSRQNSQITKKANPLVGWKQELTTQDIDQVLNILSIFNIELYDEKIEPNAAILKEFDNL